MDYSNLDALIPRNDLVSGLILEDLGRTYSNLCAASAHCRSTAAHRATSRVSIACVEAVTSEHTEISITAQQAPIPVTHRFLQRYKFFVASMRADEGEDTLKKLLRVLCRRIRHPSYCRGMPFILSLISIRFSNVVLDLRF